MAQLDVDGIGALLQTAFGSNDGLRRLLEALLCSVMKAESAAHVGADAHERASTRRGHRNGYKPRKLKTRVGELDLLVPQVRGCEPYHPSMFARWQRSERALLVACAQMYFQGVSTRNVRHVLEAMCDGEISSTTVSRVAQEIDEKLSTFRGRRLDETSWPYLQIDARYEKVRVDGRVVSQAVLVVVGFGASGRREILDWRVGDSESHQTWGQVFQDLKDRGVSGVQLITSDAHGGIVSAMRRHFQGVGWQRCRVHFKRELGRKVSHKLYRRVMSELASVFAGEDRDECLRRGREMADRWRASHGSLSRMLEEGLEDCLTVWSLPGPHRLRLQSTNLLENLMKRLKKRSRVVGVFPSRDACDRLLGAQLLEVHEGWLVESRPYFNMEHVGSAGRPGPATARGEADTTAEVQVEIQA